MRIVGMIAFLGIGIGCHCQPIVFQRTYSNYGYEHARAVVQCADSGYALVGSTSSWGPGNSDVYVVKTDSLGVYEWSVSHGGPNVEWGYDIIQTADQGYTIAGVTNSTGNGGYDMYLLRLDASGNEMWHKSYGGTDWDLGYSLKQTADGGYVILGETYSYGAGKSDLFLLRVDMHGDLLWTQTYGGPEDDIGNEVIVMYDNGYGLIGETSSFGPGKEDLYLIRTNALGDTIWTMAIGDTTFDCGNSIAQDADSNLLIIGTSDSPNVFGGKKDMWLLKMDTLGVILWSNYFGGSGDEFGESIHPIGTGHIAASGYGDQAGISNVFWYLVDNGGWYQASGNMGGLNSEEVYDSYPTLDKGFIMAGSSKSYGNGLSSAYLLKIDSLYQFTTTVLNHTDITSVFEDENTIAETIAVHPNPAVGAFSVTIPELRRPEFFEINVIGLSGARVKYYSILESTTKIDCTGLVSGLYIVEIVGKDRSVRAPLMVID